MNIDHHRAVQALLDGLSDDEIRELCIQALRSCRKEPPHHVDFALNGPLGPALVNLLVERKGVPAAYGTAQLKEALLGATALPWMAGIVESLWWFVRVGLAIPLTGPATSFPSTFRLTRAGVRFFEENEEDHPLLPAFFTRVIERCPGIPEGVVSLLLDARACLDRGLMRPAVVLMGVAFEVTVEAVDEEFVKKAIFTDAAPNLSTAGRLGRIEGKLDSLFAKHEKDMRAAAKAACDFAHDLRRRRNDAAHAHSEYGFDDRAESEELLVSAGRRLPALWALTRSCGNAELFGTFGSSACAKSS